MRPDSYLFRPGVRRAHSAFSLIEVVVAVAIFAIGMVGIIALFAPVAHSVNTTSDNEVAARVADALRVKLRTMPFATVAGMLKQTTASSHELVVNDQKSDYDPTKDAQVLFANRDGTKIGFYSDAIWLDATTRRNTDREKFFEIALIRNERISAKATTTTGSDGAATTDRPDDTAVVLAYTARLRFPAFVSDGTATGAIQVGANSGTVRFDHGKKQVLYFAGSVSR